MLIYDNLDLFCIESDLVYVDSNPIYVALDWICIDSDLLFVESDLIYVDLNLIYVDSDLTYVDFDLIYLKLYCSYFYVSAESKCVFGHVFLRRLPAAVFDRVRRREMAQTSAQDTFRSPPCGSCSDVAAGENK